MSKQHKSPTETLKRAAATAGTIGSVAATAISGGTAQAASSSPESTSTAPTPALVGGTASVPDSSAGGTEAPSTSSNTSETPETISPLTPAERKLSAQTQLGVTKLAKEVVAANVTNGLPDFVPNALGGKEAIITANVPVAVAGSSEGMDQIVIEAKTAPDGKIELTRQGIDELLVSKGGTDDQGKNFKANETIDFLQDPTGAWTVGRWANDTGGGKITGSVSSTGHLSPGVKTETGRQLKKDLRGVEDTIHQAESSIPKS
jgi:hypothetical protein